jgi:hypothetical protein
MLGYNSFFLILAHAQGKHSCHAFSALSTFEKAGPKGGREERGNQIQRVKRTEGKLKNQEFRLADSPYPLSKAGQQS